MREEILGVIKKEDYPETIKKEVKRLNGTFCLKNEIVIATRKGFHVIYQNGLIYTSCLNFLKRKEGD